MGTPRGQAKARTGPDVATKTCARHFIGYVISKVQSYDPAALFFDLLSPFGIVVGFFGVNVEEVVANEHKAHDAFGQEWICHATFELHHVVV